MANAKPSIPKYRRQKRPQSCDVAFVELNGKRHYLGDYNTPESKQRYHRLLAEWSANGGRLAVDAGDITIVELCAAFWAHAQQYYRKPDGETTSTLYKFAMALRHLKYLYGRQRAADFGPLELKAVRERMIDTDWSRGVINQSITSLRSIFKWAVAAGLIDVDVHTALTTVAPLKRSRCRARETEPKKPVPAARLERVAWHESGHVIAAIYQGYKVKSMTIGNIADEGGHVICHPKQNETTLDVCVRSMAGPIAGCCHAGLMFCRQPFDGSDAEQVANSIEQHYGFRSYNLQSTQLFTQASAIATRIVRDSWQAIRHVVGLLLKHKTLPGYTVLTAVQPLMRGATC